MARYNPNPLQRRLVPFAAGFAVLVSACTSQAPTSENDVTVPEEMPAAEGPLEGLVTVDRLPTPDDATLLAGRQVWSGTCQGCHGLGIAGSPKITDRKAWAPRIAQGKDTLYEHALKGFFGKDDSMMPERGGNPELTDEEVKAAVDFMVANSQ